MKPKDKLQKVWSGHVRNLVPKNGSGPSGSIDGLVCQGDICDTLRVQVNLTAVVRCETLQQFRQSSFGPVLFVHKRRYNSDTQVSGFQVVNFGEALLRSQTERKVPGSAGGKAYPAVTTCMRSKQSPGKPEFPRRWRVAAELRRTTQ
jgi:hypothetical protein